MYNPVDGFSKELREKREAAGQTQKGLAAKMGMSHRTIMDTELCRSSPKFETVALLARELDISLDALVFPDRVSPNGIPLCVYDYFKNKTEAQAQKYIALCQQADTLKGDKERRLLKAAAFCLPSYAAIFSLRPPRSARFPCDRRR
ncbi:MAG: helix-turn-helix transcriptional regulator [Oscillospiraceae bacterium]|uniref:helix-turn-helix domain-containing protein n=1 Tax=Frisingicoccus sp. TaxID=1918627 RepID=UPI002A7C88A0|nr:helix-turn-helix transcriptional regulator [Frisingicoccus sp.]MDY3080044.1 helix-turn-helix transcriptional regulator [Oscillospiraceae bacterium]MDY4833609.1 helix-turn-helix transcriptional regulator [Frisingicoccus sp.]